ncbi:MAG: phage integrase SAM-like domain-containing protein [Bacteroidia bacterium]
MAKAKVILFTSKTLRNGEHPVSIRITHNRKLKYYSTGLTCLKNQWSAKDFFRRSVADYKAKNDFLLKKETIATRIILDIDANEDEDFDFIEFDKRFVGANDNNKILDFFDEVIEKLKEEGRLRNAQIYKYCKGYFERFDKNKGYTFKNFKLKDLVEFDHFLRKNKKLSSRTINNIMRTFRAVVNKAILADKVSKSKYVFENFKIKTPEDVPHKALNKAQMEDFKNYEGEYMASKNLFLFSYYCQGINHKDMALIKWSDIDSSNILTYKRAKTGQLIAIKIHDKLWELIDFFNDERKIGSDDYLLPILDKDLHQNAAQIQSRLVSHISYLNKAIKKIAKACGLPKWLSISKARHSYATVLDESNVPRSLIGDAMGHRNYGVTKRYFGSRSTAEIAEANRNL